MLRKVIVLITVFTLVMASALNVFAAVDSNVLVKYREPLYGATSSYAYLDIQGLSGHLAVFYLDEQALDGSAIVGGQSWSSSPSDTLGNLNYMQDNKPNNYLFTFGFQLEVPVSYFDKTLLFWFSPYIDLVLTDCMEYEEYYAYPSFGLTKVRILDDNFIEHSVDWRSSNGCIIVDPSSVPLTPSDSVFTLVFTFRATARDCNIDEFWDQTYYDYFDSLNIYFYSDECSLYYTDLTIDDITEISGWGDITGDLEDAADGLVTPKPDLDDIDTDVVPDDGLNSINSVLSVITSDPNFLAIMVMSATLMMVSYIFFGKRG